MHNQFKKLGFLVSRNDSVKSDISRNEKFSGIHLDDSRTKHSHKKGHEASHKEKSSYKQNGKVKGVPSEEERKHRTKRPKDGEKRHDGGRHDSPINFITNSTDLFFISPEDIVKHRKRASKDKIASSEKSKHKHHDSANSKKHRVLNPGENVLGPPLHLIREPKVSKLLKKSRHNPETRSLNDADPKWLTKKEIVQLIDKTKNLSVSNLNSGSWKRYFIVDKNNVNQELGKKDNRHMEGPKPVAIPPANDNQHKKPRKTRNQEVKDNSSTVSSFKNYLFSLPKMINKNLVDVLKSPEQPKHEKKKEKKVDVMYVRSSQENRPQKRRPESKHRANEHHDGRSKDRSVRRHRDHKRVSRRDSDADTLVKKPRRKKLVAEASEDGLFHNARTVRKDILELSQTSNQIGVCDEPKKKSKTQCRNSFKERARSSSKELENKPETAKKPSSKEVAAETDQQPQRKIELVQKMLSVIEIAPAPTPEEEVEQKKKTCAFQKYYKYSSGGCDNSEQKINSSSDSSKLYQGQSEPSAQETSASSDNIEEKKAEKTTSDIHRSRIPIYSSKIGSMRKSPSGASDPGSQAVNGSLKAKKSKLQLEESNADEESSPDRNCLRITRDVVSSQLKTTKTKCKIIENPNALTSAKPSRQSTTTTSGSVDVNSSVTSSMQNDALTSPPKTAKRPPLKRPAFFLRSPRKRNPANQGDGEPKTPTKKNTGEKKPAKKEEKPKKDEQAKEDGVEARKSRTLERSATISNSNSRSVSLDRFAERTSMDSPRNPTTFMLTKTYRDPDQISRCQKRKLYSESVRRNLKNLSMVQNLKVIPPQVLEVRFLTVAQNNSDFSVAGDLSIGRSYVISPRSSGHSSEMYEVKKEAATSVVGAEHQSLINHEINAEAVDVAKKPRDGCRKYKSRHCRLKKHKTRRTKRDHQHGDASPEDDRIKPREHAEETEAKPEAAEETSPRKPGACIKLVSREQFNELFEMPIDKSLNDILNENYNFLRKDFSYTIPSCFQSKEDLNQKSQEIKRHEDDKIGDGNRDSWHEFVVDDIDEILHDETISLKNVDQDKSYQKSLASSGRDRTADSSSAFGSDESGYATIKSRVTPPPFFQRPAIKALFHPPNEGDKNEQEVFSYHYEEEICSLSDENISSICSLDLEPKKCKFMHAFDTSSELFAEPKLSEENMPDFTRFGSEGGMKKSETLEEGGSRFLGDENEDRSNSFLWDDQFKSDIDVFSKDSGEVDNLNSCEKSDEEVRESPCNKCESEHVVAETFTCKKCVKCQKSLELEEDEKMKTKTRKRSFLSRLKSVFKMKKIKLSLTAISTLTTTCIRECPGNKR